jgi:hypothetical protein
MESKRTATTYFIPPGKFLLMENALGNPDLIQSSVSSDCRVTIVDSANFPLDELEQWPTFRLTSADIKLKLGDGAYYIYIVVPTPDNTESTSAFISYNTTLVDRDGYQVIETEDEEGNPKLEKGELLGKSGFKYYQCGVISARGGNASATTSPSGQGRHLEMDLGVTPAPSTLPGDLNDFDKIFKLDKVDPDNVNSWLLTILLLVKQMAVRLLRVTDRIIFGEEGENEKPITNVKRTVDSDNEFILDENGNAKLDEEGNPIKDPKFVPVSDETIPTTAWVAKQTDWKFLRKDQDDRSVGKVASDVGFEVGDFIQGLIGGSGAKMYIDEHGKSFLEIDRIYGREELLVPKITFNCTDVITGEMAQTFAYGTIKSVDTERQIATLDLLDDEYGTPHEDDICRGTFHFLDGENSTEYSEDANGFHNYSGYSTSYFTPQEILVNEKGRMEFRYSLQHTGGVHPCVGMNFYAYGNFSDKNRQSITYHTREYTRRLEGVNTWKIQESNIVMQDGNLDGLSIGGKDMSGYSSFQKNLFLTGSVIEFTPQQEESLKGESAYSVNLSNYVGTIRIDDHGKIIDERHTEQDFEYYLRTVIQAKKGTEELFYSEDVGEGAFIASIRPVGCKATLLNGSVFVTEILDGVKHAYIEISVSCEGYATFEFVYEIKLTEDGIGGFDSLVFTRTNGTPSTPVGGSYDNPIPDKEASGMEWFDGVPDGTDQVWMSKCHFVSNGLYPENAKWSEPQPMTDTADFESIYSPRESYLPIPDNFHKNGVDIDASWLALANANHWYDEPEDWNKEGNEFSDRPACWLATNTAKNGVWQGWKVTRILGEKGDSPIRLMSSHTTITRNSLGSFEPNKVLLRAVRGEEDYHVHLLVFGIDKEGVPHRFDLGNDSYNTKWNYDLRQFEKYEYQSLEFKAYVNGLPNYPTVQEDYNAPSVAEVGLNFVANGIPGVMARNCGKHDVNKTYVYNNEYRDYVWAKGDGGAQVYIRTARGITLGGGEGQIPNIPVTNTDYWEVAPKTSMTAIDTALIDNASIGGFMFGYTGDVDEQGRPVGILKSQNDKLILDARTGKLSCIDADVDGNLNVGVLSHKIQFGTGNLVGKSMAVGAGQYTLPLLSLGENVTIQAFNPSVAQETSGMTVDSGDMYQPLLLVDENGVMALRYSISLAYDTTYTFIGVGGNFFLEGGSYITGYWIVNTGSVTNSEGVSKVMVDTVLSDTSKNPIANKAVHSEFEKVRDELSKKIQKVSSYPPSNVEPDVLYIV